MLFGKEIPMTAIVDYQLDRWFTFSHFPIMGAAKAFYIAHRKK